MIEVEKKIKVTAEQKERLLDAAELVGEKTFTDVYYDDANFALTSTDRWLRQRDGKWELKLPQNKESSSKRFLDQYEELETEPEIRKALNIAEQGSLEADLHAKGYMPFATLVTTRTKYKKAGFLLDFDSVDFGFEIAEIEVMVSDVSQMEEASQRIRAFAAEHGLDLAPVVRGKMLEYIYRNNPKHFKALEDAGVI